MAFVTLPTWGASLTPPITRQAALKLVSRIDTRDKKTTPAGWLIREGTAKPEKLKPGPKVKQPQC